MPSAKGLVHAGVINHVAVFFSVIVLSSSLGLDLLSNTKGNTAFLSWALFLFLIIWTGFGYILCLPCLPPALEFSVDWILEIYKKFVPQYIPITPKGEKWSGFTDSDKKLWQNLKANWNGPVDSIEEMGKKSSRKNK